MRALYDNKATSDNISVNSEDPNYPLTNIVDTRLSKVFRSLANDNLVINFDEQITASYCFLLNHNIPEDAIVQLVFDIYTLNFIWDENYLYVNFDEFTYGNSSDNFEIRIDFDNDSENDAYIEIGYLYLGTYLQLPGMKPDQTIKYNTTSKNKISDSGQAYANRGYRFRNPKINFPSWTEAQRKNMITFWEFVENHTPFIMLIWASELDVESPLYCILNQDGLDWKKRVKAGSGVMWSLTLELLEVF